MPVIYTTDIFGENYKLPFELKMLIGSYAHSLLLINQSKEKELSNLQFSHLKELMAGTCVLAEKYQESSKQL